MALDTRDKRASALHIGFPFLTAPDPDGVALSAADRQQVVYCYSGVAAAALSEFVGGLRQSFDLFNIFDITNITDARRGVGAAGSVVTLEIETLTFDDTTYELLGVKTGVGVLSNARDSQRYAWSDEDLAYSAAAYALAWSDGRPVQNLVAFSEDLTNDKWVPTCTVDSSSLITFAAANQTIYQFIPTLEDRNYVFSFKARNVDGNTTMGVRHLFSETGNVSTITLTSGFRRYAIPILGRVGGGNVACGLIDENGSGWGQAEFTEIQLEETTGKADTDKPSEYCPNDTIEEGSEEHVTNGTFDSDTDWTKGIGWSISGGAATAQGGTSDAKYLDQLDAPIIPGTKYYYSLDITGTLSGVNYMVIRLNNSTTNITSQAAASGIVTAGSTGGIRFRSEASATDLIIDNVSVKRATNGYAVYGTENGNSVASNVVTEGVGAALTTVPRLSHSPAATNILTHSNDLTDLIWTTSNASPTFDQVGLTGYPDTASVLGDDSSGGSGPVNVEKTAITVTAGQDNLLVVYAKKKQINYIALQTILFDAAANGLTYFNLDTGSVVSSTHSDREITEVGNGYYRCVAQFTPASDPGGRVVVHISETGTGTAVGLDGTSDVYIGNIEVLTDKDIASGRDLPPIFTETAAVSTTADDYTLDIANHDNTRGAIYFEWTPSYSASEVSGNLNILSPHTVNGLTYYDATNEAMESFDGTNTASVALSIVAGTTYKVGLVYDDTEGKMRVCVDGTWGTEATYDGAYATSTELALFLNNAYHNGLFDLRMYDAAYADAQTQIDTLMA